MTEYAGSSYIKFDDVVGAPRREKIADVRKGDFGRPVLALESGALLTVNQTNARTLVRAYGKDPSKYIGMIVELFAGQTKYENEIKDSVLIRPISKLPSPPAEK